MVELGMNARIPDEVHMKPVLEVIPALFLALPHPEPVRVERHDLWFLSALLIHIVIEQKAQMLGYLIAELNSHAHIGHSANQRLQHRLGLISVLVRGEVREYALQFIASDKGAVRAHHYVVA